MKKWIVILIVALLTGCSEPVSTAYKSASHEKQEKQREQMDVKVHVYSLEQNNAGYIIKWDERDKWVITNASVVYQHPKALIETSNNQLLEGDIVYIDIESNIAVLHFRNSADVLLKQYTDTLFKVSSGVPKQFISFDKGNTPLTINEATITNLAKKIGKDPLPFDERMDARVQLQSFPKMNVNEENKIETYEKPTFSFDQDRIQLAANTFFEQYDAFLHEKPSTIFEIIANDQLRDVFSEWEVFGETYAFDNVKVTSIQYANFQYIAQFESTMNTDKVKIAGTLYFTQMNDELFVTSFVFNEI